MPSPLVSVIVPTYNRASTIGATLDSALSQTYRSLEIVVVDDGSTDDTQRVLSAYSPDVVVVQQANRGVSAARNAGINRSRGSILMFLDSDDLWLPNAVERRVEVLEAAGPSVPCVMCDLTMRRSDGNVVTMFSDRKLHALRSEGLWTNVQDILATRFLFTNQALAIRRCALEAVGLFDEDLWVMEDFDLALRLSTLGPWAYTSQALVIWIEGSSNSLSASAGRDPKRFNTTVLEICRKTLAEGTLDSRRARAGIARTTRKARRRLRLSARPSLPIRSLLRSQAFIEEEILERVYRNSWLFPKPRSVDL